MKILSTIFIFLFFIPIILAQNCEDGAVEECEPNQGICSGSVRICYNGIWGACSILPKEEICDNNIDDDCDGTIDEECVCIDGEERPCPQWTLGICSNSIQICENNDWSECDIQPQEEACENGADDDCDGTIDLEDEDCFDVNHCTNRQQDYDEEGLDCGGSMCEPCPTCTDGEKSTRLGEKKVNVVLEDGTISDCGGLCPACPTCNDGKKNQNEEEIDCGGPSCPSCELEPLEPEEPITYCGDDFCDPDEDSNTCQQDCGSSSNFLIYFFIFFILLILLFLAFLFVAKTGKRKKKQLPIKIHSSLLRPLPKDYRSERLAEKLRKIK